MKQSKTVFVTVGTTEFEQLIKALDKKEIYEIFLKFGYDKIIFQLGRGKYQPTNQETQIKIEHFGLAPALTTYYQKADLIISHCGAGTLLECLQLNKKICVVINDTLMDNHQMELYQALKEQKLIIGTDSVKNFVKEVEQLLIKVDEIRVSYANPIKNQIDKIIQQTK